MCNHGKGSKLRVWCAQACAFSVMALISMPLALADAGKANSAAYQEVTLDLDPRTKALGEAIYAEHCAACHDGNTVRAPQRYVLENVSPETILTAMIDGPMRAVASELSLEQKTAVAEFIAARKITPGAAANAGVACEGERGRFDLISSRYSSIGVWQRAGDTLYPAPLLR